MAKTRLTPSNSPLKRRAAKIVKRPNNRVTTPFPVVGIGLEAMTQLLKHLPARTGMAFVLVQHLDPTHESALTSLLSRLTEMPVGEAKNNMPLLPDQLYVIPPNKLMGISGRKLKLFPRKNAESHLPINEFFHTLAAEEGNSAVGIILSGTGADGTQGLLAIKAAGGITFAQEEKSAKYPAMPGSAITAGCVDFVLSPERIARELARVAGHPYVGPATDEEANPKRPVDEKAFEGILAVLRQRTGVDFSHYKHATLRRRIQRRMMLHKFQTLKDYTEYLPRHLAEVKELFGDILIHVTGFFRDTAVFHALKKKLFPRLFKNKTPDAPIRVWVPGCSTGEEPYSIAIALMEFMAERKLQHPVHIFGTDIHESALGKARAGVYPENIRSDVSAERLRRFFVKTEAGYRINKAVRELCIFARQNVVVDPPFSGLDFISCRNVLIYLGPALQRKVMPLFHYALKPDGFLMLGSSETVGGFADLFALLDKKAKFYVKKTTHARRVVTFGHTMPEPPALAVDTSSPVAPPPITPSLTDVQKHADRILLTNYSPAGVIINKHLEVLQFRGHTGLFLEHAQGEASLNLLKMVREGLMWDLRTAVTKAIKQNARVRQSAARVRQNHHFVDVTIEVIPYSMPLSPEKFYIVLFHPSSGATTAAEKKQPRDKVAHKAAQDTELARLKEELDVTRESLQTIIEEQEATMEELRSANEEIMSSNEELQSTNEELETAKEELQSTNEELTTLNDELESRNTELENVNNDLHNVLASVNIPIILLGSNLKIRRFTGVAEKLFNLIPGDVGRPLTDINLPLEVPDLPKLVLEVIDHLTTKELEVKDRKGHWWSVRVRPYRTTDNKIDGAVVALVDIDLIKTSAQVISQGRAFADALINAMRRPVLLLDSDLSVEAANQKFYHDFQATPAATLNRRVYSLGGGAWDIPRLRTLLEDILPQNSSFEDFEVEHNFPNVGRRKMKLDARRLALKGDKQQLILLTMDDVTDKP